jgi:polyisoprenoid-binding protein YceI
MPTPTAAAEEAATEEAAAEEPTAEAGEAAPAAAATTFVIVPEESQAQFELSELLFGQFTIVTGVTNQVAGSLTVDPTNPAASQVGVIEIGAGSFVTDNNQRNGAINRLILQTGQYPTITFTPTSLTGMPDTVVVGDSFTFEMIGQLQIRNITQEETFTVAVDVLSGNELTGSATTVILREAYNLTIPRVPSVADVSEEVELTLNFTARGE